jgi:hypothetical protein
MGHQMNIKAAADYRAHSAEARPGVIDHNDRYVLLFGLSGAIVALTVLLMN